MNSHSLAQFTGQYSVAKTLRFELKPIGKTREWILKNNIVGVKEKKLIGNDAKRAEKYKQMKILLDEMHRIFINEALESLKGCEAVSKKLQKQLPELFILWKNSSNIEKEKRKDLEKDFLSELKQLFINKGMEWREEYHKKMVEFWEEDVRKVSQKISSEKERKNFCKNLIKKVKKAKQGEILKVKDYRILFGNNEDPLRILEWKIRSGDIKISEKDLGIGDSDRILDREFLINEILSFFEGFTTYFSGFNENRANVYDFSGEKATSISHRILRQNMIFHFENIKKWEKIKNALAKIENYDWKTELQKCENHFGISFEQFFTPENFVNYLSQKGIDIYNEIIGGKVDKSGKKIQGINEFINLTSQKIHGRRSDFPAMRELYKQILSRQDKTFIDIIETHTEMVQTIKEFFNERFSGKTLDSDKALLENFYQDIQLLLKEVSQDKSIFFLSKNTLSYISNELFGEWNLIKTRLKSEFTVRKYDKEKFFSLAEIEQALNAEADGQSFINTLRLKDNNIAINKDNLIIEFIKRKIDNLYNDMRKYWDELKNNGILEKTESEFNEDRDNNISEIKKLLDKAIEFGRFIKDLNIEQKILPENHSQAFYTLLSYFTDKFPIHKLYDKVRNYATKKEYSTDKIKINFEKATLLNGWAKNKERDNLGVMFEKNGKFFLGIISNKNTQIFDYSLKTDAKAKQKELASKIIACDPDDYYRKVNYEQIASVKKDIYNLCWDNNQQKAIRKTKGREEVWGKEITRIKESRSYITNPQDKLIYFEYLIRCAKSYWSKFNLTLKEPEEYEEIDNLLGDIQEQGYLISFDKIKSSYIEEKVEKGELYLFQIYNKDFSEKKKSKGRDNLHTSYWKLLFAQENLKDVVLKLNGQAEIFFRKASIELDEKTKKIGYHYEQLKDKFSYPIIKDRRFTEDKFFFHCPITLNFKSPSGPSNFNRKVLEFLKDNPEVNIIGIDRGEKHLLYYSVVNQNGDILEQGSLNKINNGFIPRDKTEPVEIDYHAKLEEKEKNRAKAREEWKTIENIKELKAGYLSQVIHKLAELIIEYNAIVILENLNNDFKRGRTKVEKQIYQKFERALIEKLNYLCFKNRNNREEPGHYLNAYQLTDKFTSFSNVRLQSGILFYLDARYTSITDPVTGFFKNIYYSYENIKKSIDFWKSFDSIIYNSEKDRFEFTYTPKKIKNLSSDNNAVKNDSKQWTVCSWVERSFYKKNEKKTEKFLVTDEFKEIFNKKSINFHINKDIKSILIQSSDSELHKRCIWLFNKILDIRVSDPAYPAGSDQNDFILSPVYPFFDSRKHATNGLLPYNGDANGAYNIARKGLCMLRKINNEKNLEKIKLAISNTDWTEYVQNQKVVEYQQQKVN